MRVVFTAQHFQDVKLNSLLLSKDNIKCFLVLNINLFYKLHNGPLKKRRVRYFTYYLQQNKMDIY